MIVRALLFALMLSQVAQAAERQKIWIVSHRGAKSVAPENTIAAFEAARKLGADYIELDVRQSRDGELVLMHDSKVDRTTTGHGSVADLSFEEIRKLDAGGGQKVPTFREALQWGKKNRMRIDVDHKSGHIEDLAKVIRDTGMIRNVVMEGSRDRLSKFAELLPGSDTMPKVTSPDEIAAVCQALQTTVIRLSLTQLGDGSSVEAVRKCGARVSVTILGDKDTEAGMRKVIALGAQMIETDQVETLARVRQVGTTRKVVLH
jgi:glycerophosphoryl diester phosphodiesterase